MDKKTEYHSTTFAKDLQTLYKWAQQWRVTFNAKKTEYMIFSYKNKQPNYPALYLGNQPISLVKKHTHLGITFDPKMTWKEHISNVSKKANQRLSNIKRIRHVIPRKVADNLYKSLVRPVMEYGNILFDNMSQILAKEIEQVQREAMVMITQAYRRTPTSKLHLETGLLPMKGRCREQRLILYYKIANNLTPDYLKALLPKQINTNVQYNLRNSRQLRIPLAKTTKYSISFILQTSRDWNDLDEQIRESSSVEIFKANLNISTKVNPNKLFSSFATTENKHLTRIRLGLSPLKQHLHDFHII